MVTREMTVVLVPIGLGMSVKVVDSKAYHFLLSVETRLRRFLCVTEAPNISGGSKGILVEHTSCGEDVLFT